MTAATARTRDAGAFRDGLQRRLRKAAVISTVAVYTVLGPFGYAFFALLFALPSPSRMERARRLQRVTARAYRFLHHWLRLTRIAHFDHRGALEEIPGPCVILANHPTSLDVTAVMASLNGVFTVVKPSVFRRRMLRPLLVATGHVEGPGRDPASIGRVVGECVERLEHGMTLMIFPEGTRSPPGGLHPFGRLAFEIACRAKVPVVSIGVRCEPPWLSKEVPLFDPPHPQPRLALEVIGRDDPADADFDSRVLRERAQERYETWLRRV